MSKNKVYISLGTNTGNWKNNFNQSFRALESIGRITNSASIYLSEPYGYKDQNCFYNTAIELNTNLYPYELITKLQMIEKKLKKNKLIINGPRRIDLDIIFYEKIVIKNNLLTIPHPRAHLRDFVLCPIIEMNPFYFHPVLKKSIKELFNNLKEKFIFKKITKHKESLLIF